MGCCGATKKETPLAQIKESRWPTDVLFLLAYLFSWGVLFLIHQQAVAAGADPYKIVYGVDMSGNICGIDDTNNTLAAWPHVQYYEPKICVSTCNETSNVESTRMAMLYESFEFSGYCIPNLSANQSIAISVETDLSGDLGSAQEIATRGMRDLYQTTDLMWISGVSAIFWVFFAILLIRLLAGYVVAFACTFLVLCSLYAGAVTFQWASDPANNLDDDRKLAVQIVGGVFGGLGLIMALIFFFMRNQIRIAVEVVKESSRAIFAMKSIMFFPIFPAIAGVAYLSVWLYTGLYVWSVSDLSPQVTPEAVRTYQTAFFPERYATSLLPTGANMTNDNPYMMMRFERIDMWRYAAGYHFFHMLWNVQFLVYFGYLVFAGATCDWYFTSKKDASGEKYRGDGEGELSHYPVLKSLKRTMIYHLGTVALCSLIIAIVQMIRATLMYIEKTTQGTPPNAMQKALFASIQCCLKCLECCLDKLNKNALIWTAIWGDGFCTAACSAFALIWRNLHRVAAISVVSSILLSCTTLIVCSFNAATFWAVIAYSGKYDDVSSPVATCLVVFLLSWMIGKVFMTVFQSVIDTIFICFLVDCEKNKTGEMVASKTLQQLVGKYAAESKQQAAKTRETHKNRPHKGEVDVVNGGGAEEDIDSIQRITDECDDDVQPLKGRKK